MLIQRGMKMGVFTVFLTNGAHVGPVIGGYLVQTAGVCWAYYFPAIVNAVTLVVMIFAMPETLFSRSEQVLAGHQERTYTQMLFSFRRNTARPKCAFTGSCATLRDNVLSFGVTHMSILRRLVRVLLDPPSSHYRHPLHEDLSLQDWSYRTHAWTSTPDGSALGEFCSGPFSDWFMYRYAKKHSGERKPEARLPASLGSLLLCPTGILVYGICLYHKTHWMGPVMGMAIASFGLQLVTTVRYTYFSDCYKPQSGEISNLFNFWRQTFAFPLGFYA